MKLQRSSTPSPFLCLKRCKRHGRWRGANSYGIDIARCRADAVSHLHAASRSDFEIKGAGGIEDASASSGQIRCQSSGRKSYELVIRDSTSAPCVNGWRFDTKQSGDGSSTAERIYEFVWIHGNAADGRQLLGILGLANHAVNSFSYFLGC